MTTATQLGIEPGPLAFRAIAPPVKQLAFFHSFYLSFFRLERRGWLRDLVGVGPGPVA